MHGVLIPSHKSCSSVATCSWSRHAYHGVGPATHNNTSSGFSIYKTLYIYIDIYIYIHGAIYSTELLLRKLNNMPRDIPDARTSETSVVSVTFFVCSFFRGLGFRVDTFC